MIWVWMMIKFEMKKRKKEKWDELMIWVVKFCLHREKSLGMLHISRSQTGRDLLTLSIDEIFLFSFF